MKIFISWSGKLSHEIAVALSTWLPSVIQQIKPFVSSEDIKKGTRWSKEVTTNLNETDFGIICLTEDNITEPWILFEAGALSKKAEDANVCSVLFDGLQPPDIEGPLSIFQHTIFEKKDFKKLVVTINDKLDENKLKEKLLDAAFDQWWPVLEEKIEEVTKESVVDLLTSKRINKEDILEEILDTSNRIARSVARLSIPASSFDLAKYVGPLTTEVVFSGEEYNHPVRVRIYPVRESDSNNELKELIIKKNTIEIERCTRDNISQRGVSIEILFRSEYGLCWAVKYRFHKGITYFETYEVEVPEDERKELSSTIWRD